MDEAPFLIEKKAGKREKIRIFEGRILLYGSISNHTLDKTLHYNEKDILLTPYSRNSRGRNS